MTGLISGKRVWNEGEGDDEHRHRCLVRGIIKMRMKDRQEAHVWLNGGMGKDGKYLKGGMHYILSPALRRILENNGPRVIEAKMENGND